MYLSNLERHYRSALKKWEGPAQRILGEPVKPNIPTEQLLRPPTSQFSFGAKPPTYAVPAATLTPPK